MFGLVSGGQIYLKANATTVTCFEREQCERPLSVLGKSSATSVAAVLTPSH
jgi:TfoX/Sxy family transcriptional regulator of competence genes